MFGKRILILVAHPDDEVVACAASIARAREQGAALASLYLTDGCLSRETLWPWQRKHHKDFVKKRHDEAEAAAMALGLLPVGWGMRPARTLWQELPRVYEEVQAALLQYHPDQVWVPAYEGGNPDHDALNAVGFKLKARLSVLEFAEYNFFSGRINSHSFISEDETTRVIPLSDEERAAKKAAMKIYASEKKNLSSLGVEQESYRPLAAYDYWQPPHQGKLWYTRFQWVPFHHPRVDYTDPTDISKAIMAFLS